MPGSLKNIAFKSAQATIMSIEHVSRVLVKWELEPTRQNLANLFFFVDRSESPSELKQINQLPIAAGGLDEYLDYTAKLISLHKFLYYQVRAVELQNGVAVQTFYSDVVTWQGALDLVGLYIVEENEFEARYVDGVPVLIFKRMKEGVHCSCWDEVLKRTTNSHCRDCKGTGFIRGYYPYIEGWFKFEPSPQEFNLTQFGPKQPSQTDARFTNYPLLSPGDKIVEVAQNRYWNVDRVIPTEKNRTTVLQYIRLGEINRSDIEYSITIPDDVRLRLIQELEDRKKETEF